MRDCRGKNRKKGRAAVIKKEPEAFGPPAQP